MEGLGYVRDSESFKTGDSLAWNLFTVGELGSTPWVRMSISRRPVGYHSLRV
jgi:hypothetical protein